MRLHTNTPPLDEAQGLELLPQHGTNAYKHQLVALVWAALYFMLCAVIQDSRDSYQSTLRAKPHLPYPRLKTALRNAELHNLIPHGA